jgi:lipoate---protein ligase
VVVASDAQLWLDAWISRHDPLWSDDVVRGAWWFGETWAGALTALGAEDVDVHRSRAVEGGWGRLICFAGLGPGEVTVAGRKVVGLAQRRSAAGALFHSVALLRWDPEALVDLLALAPEVRPRARGETTEAAIGLAPLFPGLGEGKALLDAVAGAVVSHLP